MADATVPYDGDFDLYAQPVTPGELPSNSLTGIVEQSAKGASAVTFRNLDDETFYWVREALTGNPTPATDGAAVAFINPEISSDLAASLAAIEAKTGLIGSGAAALFQPVLTDGTIRTLLVIGDDYRKADGRAFVWTVTTSVTPTSCYLGFYKNADNQVIVEGSIVDNGATVTLTFELLKADTENLEPGEYEYTVEMRDVNGIKITPIHSLNSNSKRYARFVERRT
jgi:hypothetical protein